MIRLKKIHIIYVIGFSPKFGYLPGNTSINRAAKTWVNEKGEKVAIWSEDWGNQLGQKVKEYYPEATFEVWRPDVRADKIYTHIFDNGVINKSFPIKKSFFFSGLRLISDIYSPLMENEILKYSKNGEKIILLLPAVRKKLTVRLYYRFRKSINIINTHFLNCESLVQSKKHSFNLLKNIHSYIKFKQQFYFLKKFTSLVVAHKKLMPKLETIINGRVYFNTFGTDLSFWKNIKSKSEARKKLGISCDKKIILLSSRLVPEYQIINVLKMVSKLKKYNCYFVFTSQGPNDYMKLIRDTIRKYDLYDFVHFTGYVNERDLRDLYTASDYFFMSSKFNAGPMSSFIGMLMDKPIINTDSGLAAEILSQNNAGLLLPTIDHETWQKKFVKLLNGEIEINHLDKQIVFDTFEWKNIVDKWFYIFNQQFENSKRLGK